ncbi:D-3-phosphoglycerate dehydrogenase [Leminorella richardii]|uniref:D-3-phosphoglycerate dehydrogenase n=1 Tax=Leminorella richardii TaxID=158841 RepID=A0A2X4UPQ8_9GAMM|nr:hydroxyacid dehydrogenase [Leminorella richardii]SQI36582.1 D-3-phosphoglycerate dehydrogenase [Leminorella richardii]
MSFTVLMTAPKLAPKGVKKLSEAGCRVIYVDNPKDPDAVYRILSTEPVDAVISRTLDLTGEAIRACPTLKVITKHGVGVSNIDVDAATQRNIPVLVTPGTNSQSVAELALGLMLAAARRIALYDRDLRAGNWSRSGDGQQLSGRTLGLVGFGQIGQTLATFCMAIGMKVVAYDPMMKQSPVEGVTLIDELPELLRQSQVLSLHCPLLPSTKNLIDEQALSLLPDGAILVNTARGPLIDESAMVAALQSGKLAGAGLDTFVNEPLSASDAIASMPTVVMTPHVGGSTPDALEAMAAHAADNVLRFLNGEPLAPTLCVNHLIK